VGLEIEVDLSTVQSWELFSLHAVLVVSMVVWGALGWAGLGARDGDADHGLAGALRGFRLMPVRPLGRELALGAAAGVAIWGAVLAILVAIAAAILALGGESLLPERPPELVAFVVGQPVWVRVAAALSAGLGEESFFRGFLQPRIGIAASSLLFVLAHASYGEPFMLVGVTLLSIVYALLARWRRDVWAAVAAHAVFDGVQLLVLIPFALERLGAAGAA
jgi:membrane protease YdiL (CAAX protease family)